MKKLLLFAFLNLLGLTILKAGENPPASLSGTYQVGSSQPVYKKLTDVAAVLNNAANTVTGNVIFELNSDYTGTTGETFPIVFKQFNSTGSWTVTIRPKAGVSLRTTGGTPGVNKHIITLDGTDNLVLDGRPGGTGTAKSWLIQNSSNGGAAIQLLNDAQSNTLTWLQLEGQTDFTGMGIVYLAGTTGTQGNDNNTISYCVIKARSSAPTIAAAGIYSENNATDIAAFNSGTIITHNEFGLFYRQGTSGIAVHLNTGTTAATVSYNSFYQTQAMTSTTIGTAIFAVAVNERLASGMDISHNFIGGTAPECGGTPYTISGTGGGSIIFAGVAFNNSNGTGVNNVVSDNTIRNIKITQDAPPSSDWSLFMGIRIRGGKVEVTDNTIGNVEGHDHITLIANSGSAYNIAPSFIDFTSREGGSITGNKMGGITIQGNLVPSVANTIYGIRASFVPSDATQPFTISNNVIGSTTITDNIRSTGATMPVDFTGIYTLIQAKTSVSFTNNTVAGVSLAYAGSSVPLVITGITQQSVNAGGVGTFDGNLISDISSASLTPGKALSFQGIWSHAETSVISNNTVRNLRLTGTVINNAALDTSVIAGIVIGRNLGGVITNVYNNKIYNLASANEGTMLLTALWGMDIRGGATIYNNLVFLNNGVHKNNCEIRGIYAASGNIKVYHNTVYISGSGSGTGAASSAAAGRSATGITLAIRNNLLVNARTGGSGAHYIFYNGIATPTTGWTTATTNYNVLLARDLNRIGKWGSSELNADQWKTTGGDANSTFYTVSQISPADLFTDTATADLSIRTNAQTYVTGKGTSGTGIATDYTGKMRDASVPAPGAFEYEFFLAGTYRVGSSHTFKKLSDVAGILGKADVTGHVIFELDSDYDGTTGETFPITFTPINARGGDWTVTIRPKAGVTTRTTAGSPGSYKGLIMLDSADRITFDGRPGGVGDTTGWILRNTTSTSSGATIQFANDAQNNTLTYLQLEGQSTVTTTGVVLLGGTQSTAGNDHNTISYCTITGLSTSTATPGIGICSVSDATDTAAYNSGTVIMHNRLVNIYKSSASSIGISLDQGTGSATVTGNSFYQTRPITNTATAAIMYGIYINDPAASNMTISGNYIGGTAPECGGTAYRISSAGTASSRFIGISFANATITGENNRIYNNTIRKIDLSVEKVPSPNYAIFHAIQVAGSRVDVTDNQIGNPEGYDDIKISVGGTSTSIIAPAIISFTSRLGGSITGNTIGGITVVGTSSSSSANVLHGINVNFSPLEMGQVFNISNNQIGSTNATDNIRFTSPAAAFSFNGISATLPVFAIVNYKSNTIAGVTFSYSGSSANPLITGINNTSSSTAIIDSNLISDLYSSLQRTGVSYNFQGIATEGDSTVIRNNTIRRLRLTSTASLTGNASARSYVTGVVLVASSSSKARIYNNRIYDFTSVNNVASPSATMLTGLDIRTNAEIYNNLISLTNGTNTNNCEIAGIRASYPRAHIYHNTIYVGGNNGGPSNGAASYPIGRSEYNNTLTIRNNLLVNERTGGNRSHYLLYNGSSSPAENWTTATSDYNVLITSDSAKIGWWGTSDKSIAGWKMTGGDVNSSFHSISQIPSAALFTDLVSLEIKPDASRYVAGAGASGTGITTDFAGKTRHALVPSAGAYEYPVAVLKSLAISAGALSPAFQRPLTAYADTVQAAVTSLTITPVALDLSSTIKVNGINVLSGQPSGAIVLSPGDNTITIAVTSANLTVTNTYTVTVVRSNGTPNNAPANLLLSASLVDENAAAGTLVGTLSTIDPDAGDSFTYKLVTGDSSADNASFIITGDQLKINVMPDYETKPSYSVRIRAEDGGALFVERAFVITVADKNEHSPVITSYSGAASTTLNVPENQVAVATVIASDADPGSMIVYSVLSSDDGAYFTVNPATGELVFNAAPDFEHPSDPDENNLYLVSVQASDGTYTAVQRFKVKVTNANDNAPEFGSYDGDASVTLRVAENTATIGTVWAVDKEPGTTIVYRIAVGEDGSLCSVDPATGVLQFVTAPDFDQPADMNGDNVYMVTVEAFDGSLSASQRFKIKITNENDNTPVFISHNGNAVVELQLPENTTAVTMAAATDGDAGDMVTYSLVTGGDAALFTIDPATGKLAFVNAPDYEHPADANTDNIYTVTVRASDGSLASTQQFSVKVADVYDTPMMLTMTMKLPENSVEVTNLEATGGAPGGGIALTIFGEEDAALFAIDQATGNLLFITAPDFEQPADANGDNTYMVSVKMSDGSSAVILRLKIKITDVDEGASRYTSRTNNEPEAASAETEPGKAIKAYPNPVTGKRFVLRLDGIDAGRYMLELYTMTGQLAYRQQVSHTGTSVNYPVQLPGDLKRGMYVLKLSGAVLRHTEKLLVE